MGVKNAKVTARKCGPHGLSPEYPNRAWGCHPLTPRHTSATQVLNHWPNGNEHRFRNRSTTRPSAQLEDAVRRLPNPAEATTTKPGCPALGKSR